MPEISKTSQIKYKMDKSDYEKMRNLFGTINWETELRKSVEQTWTYFHDVYTQVTNECIPKCQVRPPRWRRLLWMSTAAVKLKKKKYWAWKRYKSTGSYEDYEKYVRKRNAAQNLSNKLRRNFENSERGKNQTKVLLDICQESNKIQRRT